MIAERLPADLRADRAARAGDEHRAARDQAADGRVVELHRLAAQKVVDLDGPQPDVVGIFGAAAEQFVDRGHHLHDGPGLGALLEQLAEPAAREPARLHEHLVDAPLRHLDRGPIDAAEHLDPGHAAVLDVGIVVEEADDVVGALRRGHEIAGEQFSRMARADDQRRAGLLPAEERPQFLADAAIDRPEAADQKDRERPVEQDHAAGHLPDARKPAAREQQAIDRGDHEHRERGRPEQVEQVAEGHPLPRDVAAAERIEDHALHRQHHRHRGEEGLHPRQVKLEVVAGEEREEKRGREDRQMHREQHRRLRGKPPKRDPRLRREQAHDWLGGELG